MRHRASRLHAVVAAVVLALLACTAISAASATLATPDPSAVGEVRAHDHAERRHDGLAPRATVGATAKTGVHAGPHVDGAAVLAALALGAILLLGWFVARGHRTLLPRLCTAAVGARAPPALV